MFEMLNLSSDSGRMGRETEGRRSQKLLASNLEENDDQGDRRAEMRAIDADER
jgi:hypothetical protein